MPGHGWIRDRGSDTTERALSAIFRSSSSPRSILSKPTCTAARLAEPSIICSNPSCLQVLQAKVSVFRRSVPHERAAEAASDPAKRGALSSGGRKHAGLRGLHDGSGRARDSLESRRRADLGLARSKRCSGQSFASFYTPAEPGQTRLPKFLRQTIADGRHEEEGWRLRKDGSRFWANVVYTAVRDDKENLDRFFRGDPRCHGSQARGEELQRLNAEMQRHVAEQTEELIRTIAQRERLHEELLQAQKWRASGLSPAVSLMTLIIF